MDGFRAPRCAASDCRRNAQGAGDLCAPLHSLSSPAQESTTAQGAERSGKEVVTAQCVACHGSGAKGAPKIGDSKAWAKRAAQGLTSLTKSALDGIRQMPPHGGNPNLTDTEIERAITYMVNQSGGHWTEPISRTGPPVDRGGEQIVRERCFKCHETGEGGAPGSATGPRGYRGSSRDSTSSCAPRSRDTAACRRAAARPTSRMPSCEARSST